MRLRIDGRVRVAAALNMLQNVLEGYLRRMILAVAGENVNDVGLFVAVLDDVRIKWSLFYRFLIVVGRQAVLRVEVVAVGEDGLIVVGILVFGEARIEESWPGVGSVGAVRRSVSVPVLVPILRVSVLVLHVVVRIEVVLGVLRRHRGLRGVRSGVFGVADRLLRRLVRRRLDSLVTIVRRRSLVFVLILIMSKR